MRTFCAAVSRVKGGKGGRPVGVALISFSRERSVSVDHEKCRAVAGEIAMPLSLVGDLKAHARRKHELAAVLELDLELAVDAEEDMPLRAPVARQVARRVFDHAHAHVAALQ